MEDKKTDPVGAYFAALPAAEEKEMNRLRAIIRKAAPGAVEVISYGMPAFKLHGLLVWYAVYKEHCGFYPTSKPIVVFREKLKAYKTSKGAIQFPRDKPLPVKLITDIVKFRIREDREKAALKKAGKKSAPKKSGRRRS